MSNKYRLRRLTVGDTTWLWSVRHKHDDGRCREILSLRREGAHARLRLVFRDGNGRFAESGAVGDRNSVLNLHKPSVVRGLLDTATERGLLPDARNEREVDGWTLFDTVVSRLPDDPDPEPHPGRSR